MIIDAENLILGRLACFAVKNALLGEQVEILNSEKVVIIGNKENIFKKYKRKREMGDTLHGPYFPKRPDMILKRTIRGMLPYKQDKGRKAFKRIKCYVGIPLEFKDKPTEKLDFKLSKEHTKFITVGELSGFVGGSY